MADAILRNYENTTLIVILYLQGQILDVYALD